MEVITQLQQIRQSLPPPSDENSRLRENLLNEARQLCLDLERPDNVIERIGFGSLEPVVVHTATKMGVFPVINDSGTTTVEEVAKACNADVTLVARLLRALSAYGAIEQKGENAFGPAKVSRVFGDTKGAAAIEALQDIMAGGWNALPSFLANSQWQNPASATKTALAQSFNRTEGATLYEIMKTLPALKAFNIYMASFNEGHKSWLDIYPITERIRDGADEDPSAVMMVDVGGGFGQQAIGLKRAYPDWPGRIIVQDLPQGLPVDKPSEVEVVFTVHNFFEEQPIKGARFYYFRYIMHNYPADACVAICTQIRKAMKPGYSRLIINDWILPDIGQSRLMTAMDFNMMTITGGLERTLPLHKEYLERAGLKVTGVWNPDDGISESVIEAEVA